MSLKVSPQPPVSNPTTSLQAALKFFEHELTKEQKQSFLQANHTWTPADVVVFIAELDATNQSSRRSVSSRLFKFLDAAQQFVDVVDTFISSHPNVAALVWGGIKASLIIANNSLPYFNKVTAMITDIGKLSPTYAEFGKLYQNDQQIQTKLCEYYAIIVRICTAIVRSYSRSGFASRLLSSFEAHFKPLLDDLEKEQKRLHVCLHLASQRLISESAHNIAKEKNANSLYRQVAARFQSTSLQEQARVRTSLAGQYRRQILDNLSTIRTRQIWSMIQAPRVSGTAEWFMQELSFESWCQSPHTSTLWCSGNMGVGKSVLVSSIVAHVERTHLKNTSVSYHFCQTGHEDTLTARGVLGSITRQLLSNSISRLESDRLEALLARSRDLGAEEFVDLLGLYLEPSPQRSYFVILDGLDECSESNIVNILSQLKRIVEDARFRVRLLYSSRPSLEKTIIRFWKHDARLVLDKAATQQDIEKFIGLTLQRYIAEGRLQVKNPDLLPKIVKVLEENHNGMFLWVSLFIEELCDVNRDADVVSALNQPPEGIKELYSRKLLRIRSHTLAKDCLDVLRFTGVARRPLKTEEMREALSVDLNQREFDSTKLPNDMNRIVGACSGLIHVDAGTEMLLFVHSSLHQYLFRKDGQTVEGFDYVEVSTRFSSICLTYLNYRNFTKQIILAPRKTPQFEPVEIALAQFTSSKVPGSKLIEKFVRARKLEPSINLQPLYDLLQRDSSDRTLHFDFFEYASRNWLQQIRNHVPSGRSGFWNMLHQCIENPALDEWKPWLAVQEKNVHQWSSTEQMVTWALSNENNALLFYLTKYRMSDMRDVIEEQVLKHALEYALEHDSDFAMVAVVRSAMMQPTLHVYASTLLGQLLRKDKNPDKLEILRHAVDDIAAASQNKSTPLHWASTKGHSEVVKVLLAAGADANAMNKDKWTPLQWASMNGHLEVVKLLIAGDADVNAVAKHKWTPLQWASLNGHLEIVKVLLAAGSDVDAFDGFRGTPLLLATEMGHLEAVKVLLAAGANVNTTDSKGWTPLLWASAKGDLEVVKVLLTANADVHAVNLNGWTPLYRASMGSNLEMVTILLTAGAESNTVDQDKWTPLHLASRYGFHEIVKILLTAGADVNVLDRYRETPLHKALRHGYLEVVKSLLAAGADVHATNSEGLEACQFMHVHMNADIQKLLLQYLDTERELQPPLNDTTGNGIEFG